MQLAGQRATLRPWRKADAASLVTYADNLNVARQLRDRFPHPYTNADARHYIQSVADVRPTSSFAIALTGAGGDAIGGIGFSAGADVERFSAEIGYWLGEPFWGRGIVTDALKATTGYAIERFGLTRVYAVPFAWNGASVRVLEKAGYVLEGRLRRSAVKDGVITDQLQYAFIAPVDRPPPENQD
jgi:[ribosomal protein S5]-alanine N-acetyltransferase